MTLTAPPRVIATESDEQAFFDEQALFKEARRRRRLRRLKAAVVVVLATAGALTYWSIVTTGSTNAHPTNTKSTPPMLVAGPFAGTWHVKYYYVRIADNGRGLVTWPIKALCGESKQSPGSACDTLNQSTGAIHDGGHAQIRLVSVTGSHADAVVSGSTELSLLPDGTTLLRYSSSDVIYFVPATLTISSPFGRSSFCGPTAATLSFTQQTAEHIDCGT